MQAELGLLCAVVSAWCKVAQLVLRWKRGVLKLTFSIWKWVSEMPIRMYKQCDPYLMRADRFTHTRTLLHTIQNASLFGHIDIRALKNYENYTLFWQCHGCFGHLQTHLLQLVPSDCIVVVDIIVRIRVM